MKAKRLVIKRINQRTSEMPNSVKNFDVVLIATRIIYLPLWRLTSPFRRAMTWCRIFRAAIDLRYAGHNSDVWFLLNSHGELIEIPRHGRAKWIENRLPSRLEWKYICAAVKNRRGIMVGDVIFELSEKK